MCTQRFAAALLVVVVFACAPAALAQSAFTYQGRLSSGGLPANGTFDIQFRLFTAPAGGSQLGGTQCLDNVAVSKGIFMVTLDFGAQFNGSTRYLEIAVRQDVVAGNCNVGVLTTLAPRQAVTNAPQSATAAQGARPSATAWDLIVSGSRALRSAYATTVGPSGFRSHNMTSGADVNSITPASIGSVIAGGGSTGINNADLPNTINGNFAAISGGEFNGVNAAHSAIGGGFNNTVNAGATESFIGGGSGNTAGAANSAIGGGSGNTASGPYAVVSGGLGNQAIGNSSVVGGGQNGIASGGHSVVAGGFDGQATGGSSVVGGGVGNMASNLLATVAGGAQNQATGGQAAVGGGFGNIAGGTNSTIAGGFNNEAPGVASSIGGGNENIASGLGSCVPGGFLNDIAGDFSFGAGYRACTAYEGSFVWSDRSSGGATLDPRANTFTVRAAGGAFLTGGGLAIQASSSPYPSSSRGLFLERGNNGSEDLGLIFTYDYSTGLARPLCLNSPGGTVGIGTITPSASYTLHVNGPVAGIGAYNALSDARYKTNVRELEAALEQVLAMRGVSYDWDDAAMEARGYRAPAGRHIGVLAQEIERVVPEAVVTADDGDKSVAYDALTPLLIEAIKAQQQQIEEMRARLAALEGAR